MTQVLIAFPRTHLETVFTLPFTALVKLCEHQLGADRQDPIKDRRLHPCEY